MAKNKLIETAKNTEWESSENGENAEFIIEGVRFAFTQNGKHLLIPESYKKNTKYKGQFILPEEAIEQVLEVATFLIVNNTDVDSDFVLDLDDLDDNGKLENLFLHDGNDNTVKDTDEPYTGFADKFYVKATRSESMGAPAVFGEDGNEITDAEDKRLLKDGCYGNIAVRAYYSKEWNMVGLTIEAVVYTDEGEAFTGDSSFSGNEEKKNKLFGSHKPKASKADEAFGKKKDKKGKKKGKSED